MLGRDATARGPSHGIGMFRAHMRKSCHRHAGRMWQYARRSCKDPINAVGDRARPAMYGPAPILSISKGEMMISSVCFRLLASSIVLALCWSQSSALAGDLEDCNGAVADKIEPACTAIIGDASRPTDDRLKAYVSRSRFFASRAKLDAAAADAEAALQLNPQFVPALVAHGYALQRKGSFDQGLADLNRAVELDPKNAFAIASRGGLRNDQKAWTEAIADFNQAITLRQDFAAAYVGRARASME